MLLFEALQALSIKYGVSQSIDNYWKEKGKEVSTVQTMVSSNCNGLPGGNVKEDARGGNGNGQTIHKDIVEEESEVKIASMVVTGIRKALLDIVPVVWNDTSVLIKSTTAAHSPLLAGETNVQAS